MEIGSGLNYSQIIIKVYGQWWPHNFEMGSKIQLEISPSISLLVKVVDLRLCQLTNKTPPMLFILCNFGPYVYMNLT